MASPDQRRARFAPPTFWEALPVDGAKLGAAVNEMRSNVALAIGRCRVGDRLMSGIVASSRRKKTSRLCTCRGIVPDMGQHGILQLLDEGAGHGRFVPAFEAARGAQKLGPSSRTSRTETGETRDGTCAACFPAAASASISSFPSPHRPSAGSCNAGREGQRRGVEARNRLGNRETEVQSCWGDSRV